MLKSLDRVKKLCTGGPQLGANVTVLKIEKLVTKGTSDLMIFSDEDFCMPELS